MSTLPPEMTPGGSTSWANNVPDPLLSTDQLPVFTYDLEAAPGKTDGRGSFGKEVTVAELPISKGIAGVPRASLVVIAATPMCWRRWVTSPATSC